MRIAVVLPGFGHTGRGVWLLPSEEQQQSRLPPRTAVGNQSRFCCKITTHLPTQSDAARGRLELQAVCSVLISHKTKTKPCCPETRCQSSWQSDLCGFAWQVPAQGNTNGGDAGGSGESGVRRAEPGEGQGCQCPSGAGAAVDFQLSAELGAGREERAITMLLAPPALSGKPGSVAQICSQNKGRERGKSDQKSKNPPTPFSSEIRWSGSSFHTPSSAPRQPLLRHHRGAAHALRVGRFDKAVEQQGLSQTSPWGHDGPASPVPGGCPGATQRLSGQAASGLYLATATNRIS